MFDKVDVNGPNGESVLPGGVVSAYQCMYERAGCVIIGLLWLSVPCTLIGGGLPILNAADPVWQHLKSAKGGFLTADIKWNFSKVSVAHSSMHRWLCSVAPDQLACASASSPLRGRSPFRSPFQMHA